MSKLLTFEFDEKNEVLEIHGNTEGLVFLREKLDLLIKEKGLDHLHMMISSWGGTELSEEKQSEVNKLVPHVKICKWRE